MKPRASTARLYVHLSASQTRKRLRGYGFGVRRVESVDRNQAAIVHTATGQHLRGLQRLFADVVTSASPSHTDAALANLRNLGLVSAGWLREAGLHTLGDLQRLGAAAAYQLVSARRPEASLNLLWALAGALADRDWRAITDAEKEILKQELDQLRGGN